MNSCGLRDQPLVPPLLYLQCCCASLCFLAVSPLLPTTIHQPCAREPSACVQKGWENRDREVRFPSLVCLSVLLSIRGASPDRTHTHTSGTNEYFPLLYAGSPLCGGGGGGERDRRPISPPRLRRRRRSSERLPHSTATRGEREKRESVGGGAPFSPFSLPFPSPWSVAVSYVILDISISKLF